MEKYDIHLHLTLEQYPPIDGMKVSSAENMLPHLHELGIEKGVLMSTGEGRKIPFGTNDECAAIARKFPEQYAWMCNVEPFNPESLPERLAAYKAMGAVGIGEVAINKPMDSEFLQTLFAVAEKEELPVLLHMSPEENYEYGVVDRAGLPLFRSMLKKYPKLKFIGHSQPFWHEISGDASKEKEARNSWGEGPVKEGGVLLTLLEECPNLYCDLSANSGGCALMRDPEFGIWFINKYHDRLLFGTDMTHTEMVFPLGAWLEEQCEKGNISEKVCKEIFVENAKRLLHI